MRAPAVALIGIRKRFGAVIAAHDVHLEVEAGTIHGILGAPGAGKSTLARILAGLLEPDAGSIRVDGRELPPASPRHAIRTGIGLVDERLTLVGALTVLDNVLLGAEGSWRLRTARDRARARLAALARSFGLELDPKARVETLAPELRLRTALLKALYRGAHILVLDEPAGAAGAGERQRLARALEILRAQGRTVLVFTREPRAVLDLADRVSVMRSGRVVARRETAFTGAKELLELMAGRRIARQVSTGPARPQQPVLEVVHLEVRDGRGRVQARDVGFTVRAGEIVGVVIADDRGRRALVEAICGVRPAVRGEVRIKGRRVRDALRARTLGLAYLPEERRGAVVGSLRLWEHVLLGYQWRPEYRRLGLLRRRFLRALCARWMETFALESRDPDARVEDLCEADVQKLVWARELGHEPELLLVVRSSRDMGGAEAEWMHHRLRALRDAGRAILVVSQVLDEVRRLCDRILVMADGRITEAAGGAALAESSGDMTADPASHRR